MLSKTICSLSGKKEGSPPSVHDTLLHRRAKLLLIVFTIVVHIRTIILHVLECFDKQWCAFDYKEGLGCRELIISWWYVESCLELLLAKRWFLELERFRRSSGA